MQKSKSVVGRNSKSREPDLLPYKTYSDLSVQGRFSNADVLLSARAWPRFELKIFCCENDTKTSRAFNTAAPQVGSDKTPGCSP